MERHPLSALWGDMPEGEYRELVVSVSTVGLIERRIYTLDGMVLDGWHRYRACSELGQMDWLVHVPYEGKDPAGFVIARNATRRHQSAMDRARAVVASRAWAPEGNPDFVPTSETTPNGGVVPEGGPPQETAQVRTEPEMATEAGVSVRTIQRAKAEARQPDVGTSTPEAPAPPKSQKPKAPKEQDYRQLRMDFDALQEQYDTVVQERDEWKAKYEDLQKEYKEYKSTSTSSTSSSRGGKRGGKAGPTVSQEFIDRMVEEFPAIDVQGQVELALSHKAALKYTNMEAYVRNWLKRAASWEADREGARAGARPRRPGEPSTDEELARFWGS